MREVRGTIVWFWESSIENSTNTWLTEAARKKERTKFAESVAGSCASSNGSTTMVCLVGVKLLGHSVLLPFPAQTPPRVSLIAPSLKSESDVTLYGQRLIAA